MNKDLVYRVGIDMIYLASCALDGRLPEKNRLLEMDFDLVHRMAKKHSMQAITYISLAKALEKYNDIEIDEQLLSGWKKEYHMLVNKLVQLDMERESLYAFLESEGAWYIGLKGIHLSRYYPTLGMRQMTDNDILVDADFCPRIRDYFTSRGYKVESYGNHCHDIYMILQ